MLPTKVSYIKLLSVTDASKYQSLHVFLMILNMETFLPHAKSKYRISEQCSLSIALYTRVTNLSLEKPHSCYCGLVRSPHV